jgi:hypothetical protein
MVYNKVDSIPDTLQLSMLGHQILRSCENGPEKTCKLVGVHLDEKLTFKHHITTVQKKIGQSIAIFLFFLTHVSFDTIFRSH